MDELMWLRLFGGGFGSGVDLAAVLAFIAFSLVVFLGPVLGYQGARSAGITASLFLLVGYVAVSLVQLLVQWVQLLGGSGGGFDHRGDSWVHMLLAFALLKMVLFLAAMLSFAVGVCSLRVRRVSPSGEEDAPGDRGRD